MLQTVFDQKILGITCSEKSLDRQIMSANIMIKFWSTFMSNYILSSSMLDVMHPSNPKSYTNCTCNICQKVFSDLKDLKIHETLIHRAQIIKCSVCEAKYQKKYHLRMHMDHVHEKVTHSKCDICGSSFVSKSHLTRHKMVMHN